MLQKLEAGRIDAVLATVASIEGAHTAIEKLGAWLFLEQSSHPLITIARTVSEIRAAKRAGNPAVILHFQGGTPIETDLNLMNVYHALGVRVIQLTYNYRNFIGDGCLEENDGGLSDFGRKAIKRMNDLRISIDISHVGERTSLEAIETSQQPVIASHANVRALCDSPRNLSNRVIDAIAQKGGVIGVCAFPAFIYTDRSLRRTRWARIRRRAGAIPRRRSSGRISRRASFASRPARRSSLAQRRFTGWRGGIAASSPAGIRTPRGRRWTAPTAAA
jgi:membrane dipeptidase